MSKFLSVTGLLLATAQAQAMQVPLQETVHQPQSPIDIAKEGQTHEVVAFGRGCGPAAEWMLQGMPYCN